MSLLLPFLSVALTLNTCVSENVTFGIFSVNELGFDTVCAPLNNECVGVEEYVTDTMSEPPLAFTVIFTSKVVLTRVPFSRTIVSDSDDVNIICGASACTNAHFHNSSDVFETIFEPAGI